MISFVIPVYNEKDNVKPLFQAIQQTLQHHDITEYEVLFIDDGSSDGTTEGLKELARLDKNIYVYILKRNYGKSTALNVGFKSSSGDIVFTLDADLQDDPEEIPRFLKKINEEYDMVSGWKKDRKDPFEKKIASKIFNAIVSGISGIKLHDFNCGFKAYRKEVVDSLDLYGEFHRFIPLMVADKGYKIGEIPVKHHQRHSGKSKYGLSRYLIGFFDFLSIYFVLKYASKPFHFIGGLGLVSVFSGILLLFYTAVAKFGFGDTGVRPALFIGLFLISFSINLFTFGFIADLLVKNSRTEVSTYKDYLK